MDAGARLLVGGKRHGAVVEPTVLENVPSDCHVACDEVFGPVMILDRYASFKDAVAKCALFPTLITAFCALSQLSERVLWEGFSAHDEQQCSLQRDLPTGVLKSSCPGTQHFQHQSRDMLRQWVQCSISSADLWQFVLQVLCPDQVA